MIQKDLIIKLRDSGFKPRTLSTKWTFDSYFKNKESFLVNAECYHQVLCEAQRWLREIHEINLFMCTCGVSSEFYTVKDITLGLGEDRRLVGNSGCSSVVYEEALAGGINKALDLLKINKP